MGKRLYFNHEARRLLQAGVDELANTVKVTLGPEGPQRRARAAHRARRRSPTTASRSRARSSSRDQFKNMGAQLVREVANKTSDLTGDGTTTATLLAQAIVREGMRALDEGANPMLLRRGHRGGDRACLVGRAAAHRRGPSRAARQLEHVATIAAKEDELIGEAVAEALDRVGTEGVVTIEECDVPGIAVDFVEGMHVENGWISPYMVRDPERMETVFEDPYILMTNKPISHPQRPPAGARRGHEATRGRSSSWPRRSTAARSGCWSPTTSTARSRRSPCARPGFGHRRIQHLGDLAAFTGGAVIAEEAGPDARRRAGRAPRHARGG